VDKLLTGGGHDAPIRTESKYMFAAERFAKTDGCASPVASINLQWLDSGTFTVACANGEPLIVRCEGRNDRPFCAVA